MDFKGQGIVIKVVVFAAVLLAAACISLATDKPAYRIVQEYNLPAELAETSGLYCPDPNSLYSINDSGNKAIIYQLDLRGQIVQQIEIKARNNDWEAISGDEQYFYIGDIGNNNGKRETVNIHVYDKQALNDKLARTLKISYLNNNPDNNEYLAHDFDAEALVSVDDTLLLFSKSWQSTDLHIYPISKSDLQQKIAPLKTVQGLPGVVTGVDYHPVKQEFVLVGYSVRGLGSFSPFIARLDRQYNLLASYPLSGFNQVEGVCVDPAGDIWITQESSFFSTHKLARLVLL